MENSTILFDILKILGTAILSFASGFVLFSLSKKKDKKEISYDLKIIHGLLNVSDVIKKDIQILYRNNSTENLTYAELDLYNSGTQIVKNQEVRITCPLDCKILELIFEPQIEPELHFENIDTKLNHEKKFRLGHFERNQRIGIRFVIAGDNVDIKIHPYNPEGNVSFNPKSITKSINDKDILTSFFTLLLMFFTLPVAISGLLSIGGELGSMVDGLFRVIILIFLIKRSDAIRIIVNKLFNNDSNSRQNQIHIYNNEGSDNRINIQ